jgi:hypothetical protein
MKYLESMLTPAQKQYLKFIPLERMYRFAEFHPGSLEIAENLIELIQSYYPQLECVNMGSSAFGIGGSNSIEVHMLSTPKEFFNYIPQLVKMFDRPVFQSPFQVEWHLLKTHHTVELCLSDRNSQSFQEYWTVCNAIQNNPDIKASYLQMKQYLEGSSYREYVETKFKFFNYVLSQQQPVAI